MGVALVALPCRNANLNKIYFFLIKLIFSELITTTRPFTNFNRNGMRHISFNHFA